MTTQTAPATISAAARAVPAASALRAMTRLAGMPGYRYVVVGNSRTPLCDWDDSTVASVAKEIAGEAEALPGGGA